MTRATRIYIIAFALLGLSLVPLAWSANKAEVGGTRQLLLGHNLNSDHPVHMGMEVFKKALEEKSGGKIKVTLYPSAQLGTEKEVIELVQLGAVSMTKVSSLSLDGVAPLVGVLNTPFIFRDRGHFFRVLDGPVGEELKGAARSASLYSIGYYDAGDRSFYATKPIQTPDDVKGLKIRVMENATAIKMLQLLGGNPTPMPFGEVYTALQQGVIEGAENNITALTLMRHGEVAKYYSVVQHIFAPDILMISTRVWDSLDDDEKAIVQAAAKESVEFQRKLWEEKTAVYEKEAQEKLGVKISTPSKAPFVERVSSLHEEISNRGDDYRRLLKAIKETP